MIGPFNKPKDKLTEELSQLEKTKAELERKARELETVLNIPQQPEVTEEPVKGARFLNLDESNSNSVDQAAESARLKIEQRKAKRRVISLVVIAGILLLLIIRMIS